jgi:hypothetical protein
MRARTTERKGQGGPIRPGHVLWGNRAALREPVLL